ncbi:hypothetical protein [Microbulbifer hainanensis]|uniref:hypothetical protein n=1 Tax=Microbulbifer hainanensis TaxID=2735675 RepID=UPI00186939D3|nr:hypothetical protein [Microbulbifer hainanensis]
MNKSILAAVIVSLAAAPALAQKPDTTDKGKPSQEQMEAHHKMMEANSDGKNAMMEEHGKMAAMKHTEAEAHGQQHAEMVDADAEDKMMKEEKMRMKEEKMRMKDEHKGMEKQREKKAEQEQKELDKGSEQGQAAREEHSKKWWQFWKS